MQPLTTSVYTFSELIAGGYLYVDKTAGIHELIRGYKGQYFLSRPRRFGKSLLISTLKAIFQGRRELYRFEENAPTVYNPVSVMKCFQERKFRNYWFETGTPTFLVELLRRQPVDLGDLAVDENAFSTYDPAASHPLPLLFQTGYLTIRQAENLGDNTRNARKGLTFVAPFLYWPRSIYNPPAE